MISEDLVEVQVTLERIKKFCKVAGIVLNIVFILVVAYWLILLLVAFASLFIDIDLSLVTTDTPALIIPLACSGFLLASLFKIGATVFLDVSHGESPFTLIQAKRLKWLSVIVVLYVFLEALLSPGFMAVLQLNGFDVGYSLVDYGANPSISINVGALFVAVVFFSLSLVFKYGVLLQEFSDETL